MPGAIWRPVNAHGGPMIAHHGLVLHVQVGNGSCYGLFSDPNAQASSTWWVAKDGTVEQYVDSDTVAWTQAAGNSTWNGVETEGYPSEDLTIPQLSSLADIYRWGQTTYGWPLITTDDPGGSGFGWHGMGGAAWGGHYGCPGDIRKAQRQTILDLVSPQPTTKEYEIMDSVVLADNTIVSHAVTPQGHYLEITRHAGQQGQPANVGLSIIDITAAYPQFEVQP